MLWPSSFHWYSPPPLRSSSSQRRPRRRAPGGRLSASIHLSRLSATSKAKWKSKHGIPRPVPIPNSILFKLIQLFKNARGKTVHCFMIILIRRFGTSLIFSTITNPSEVSPPPPPSAAFAATAAPRKHSVTFRPVPVPVPVLPSMLLFFPSSNARWISAVKTTFSLRSLPLPTNKHSYTFEHTFK